MMESQQNIQHSEENPIFMQRTNCRSKNANEQAGRNGLDWTGQTLFGSCRTRLGRSGRLPRRDRQGIPGGRFVGLLDGPLLVGEKRASEGLLPLVRGRVGMSVSTLPEHVCECRRVSARGAHVAGVRVRIENVEFGGVWVRVCL